MPLHNPLPESVVRAMDAAERLLGEPIGLDDLARAAGLSRFHFHRVFRQAVTEPAGAFVERLQLERAALLLLAGEIPARNTVSAAASRPSLYTSRCTLGVSGGRTPC